MARLLDSLRIQTYFFKHPQFLHISIRFLTDASEIENEGDYKVECSFGKYDTIIIGNSAQIFSNGPFWKKNNS